MAETGNKKKHMKVAPMPKRVPGGWYYHPHELAICGFSGSGKTTLILKLIEYWANRGRFSAYLKHDAHVIDMDKEGKDSFRAWEAEAQIVGIQSAGEHALRRRGGFDAFTLPASIRNADILIVEGNKRSDLPKILMLDDRGEAEEELGRGSFQSLLAIAGSSEQIDRFNSRQAAKDLGAIPRVNRDDHRRIIEIIETAFIQSMPPLLGLVLVGGRSRRMGRDKASLKLGEVSMARRALDLLAPYCKELYLSCREDQELPDDVSGVKRIPDSFQNMGPTGGILSAMREHPGKAFFVLACDMPLIEKEDISALVAARDSYKFATSFLGELEGEQFPEPLCSIYEPKFYQLGLLGMTRDLFCPRRLLSMSPVRLLEPLRKEALHNANTPQDWDRSLATASPGVQEGAEPGLLEEEENAPLLEAPAPEFPPMFAHELERIMRKMREGFLEKFRDLSESLGWDKSLGRTLAQPLVADMDQPPFNRAAMDGMAIRYADLEKGIKTFRILAGVAAGVDPAGLSWQNVQEKAGAEPMQEGMGLGLEIMTGAPVPEGFDTVIQLENYSRLEDRTIFLEKLPKGRGDNIHPQAVDYRKGDVLVPAGHKIGPADIPLVVSLGGQLEALPLPRLAILGTGSELVAPQDKPGPGQIRSSNVESLAFLARCWGVEPFRLLRLEDQRSLLKEEISGLLKEVDVLVICGGVSMGRYDYVPGILAELGVKALVHGMKQRPGKPFYIGRSYREDSNKPAWVFGLPGNPVSSFLGFRRWIIPFMIGAQADPTPVHAAGAEETRIHLSRYMPVILDEGPERQAKVVQGNGSGDFSQLLGSQGFIELRAKDASEAQNSRRDSGNTRSGEDRRGLRNLAAQKLGLAPGQEEDRKITDTIDAAGPRDGQEDLTYPYYPWMPGNSGL